MQDYNEAGSQPYQQPEDSLFDSDPVWISASTGQRFANFVIDFIVVRGLTLGFFFLLGGLLGSLYPEELNEVLYEFETNPGYRILDYLMTAAVTIVFYALIEGFSKGRSLGKLITNTQAVTEDGGPISWGNAWKRSLCRLVPFEPFSGLSGFPWHDTWTNTMVVKRGQQA